MSSTNRSEREGHDFFETPAWAVERLLETGVLNDCTSWLEPAAGRGAIVRAVGWSCKLGAFRVPRWRLIEIDKEHVDALADATPNGSTWLCADFLALQPEPGVVDVIITNPPFDLAPRFIEQAFKWKPQKLALLLRLNFLASEARAPFMHAYAPDVYVLPNRPNFMEGQSYIDTHGKKKKKGGDSIEYAWFVWDMSLMPRAVGTVRVLATTPQEVRKRKAA